MWTMEQHLIAAARLSDTAAQDALRRLKRDAEAALASIERGEHVPCTGAGDFFLTGSASAAVAALYRRQMVAAQLEAVNNVRDETAQASA